MMAVIIGCSMSYCLTFNIQHLTFNIKNYFTHSIKSS